MESEPHAPAPELPSAEVTGRPGDRRNLVLIAVVIPVVLIGSLLIWATVRAGGRAGGTVNDVLGEVRVNHDSAPSIQLTSLDGSSVSLADHRGRIVMVDFWASWCPPCESETPILTSVYDRYREQGVDFIGISIWDRSQDAVSFVNKYEVQYPVAIDNNGTVAIDYGVTGIPEKFFIDAEGRLVHHYVGPMDVQTLTGILDEMLAGQPAGS